MSGDGAARIASGRVFGQIPAVRALLIQCLSLALLLILARSYTELSGLRMNLLVAALLQGALAATASRFLGLASWWTLIQLCFPPAVVLAFYLQLPPWLFLLAFLLLLVLYWSCFRTQVPYYPSSRFAQHALLAQLPAGRPLHVIDIGSGLGGLVLALADLRPDCRFMGIELAPLPWLVSIARARIATHPARFLRGDYHSLDFARFDVVFAYLSPAAMSALWLKASREMRPGSLLFSYEFLIPEKGPDVTILDEKGGPPLYGWRF